MIVAPVTSVLCALSAVGLVALSAPVSMRRFKARVLLGDGRDKVLLARIRAQANFVEYVPVALLLLGLAELNGASVWAIGATATAFAVGRVVHAWGMLTGARTRPRQVAMLLTWIPLLVGAGLLAASVLTLAS